MNSDNIPSVPTVASSTDKNDQQKVVLFVGSFVREIADGSNGGQMFACYTLVNSRLSQQVDWVLVDSTATLPLRHVAIRALIALKRVLTCSYYLLTRRIDTTLVFTSHGVSFMEKGLIVLLSRLRGRRAIIAPRSGLIINDFDNPLMRRYIQLVLRSASLVICQSPHWQSIFENIAPGVRCEVIHNWVDHSAYPHSEKLPSHNRPIRLLFLGWVTKDKGILELVEAIAILARKHNIVLNVCGHGDAYDSVISKIEELNLQNNIEMKGWVKHAEKLQEFQQADIFVQPTHYEGFPNSLLEAMSSGVPTVCSDIPAISSLVSNHHDTMQFRTKDVDSLCDAIEKLIESPELRQTVADNAQLLVERKFSMNYGVKSFEDVL